LRTIAITNRKGGVGKSTTAVNLAHALALANHRVLAIDCDSQHAGITTWLTPTEVSDQKLELADALLDPKQIHAATIASNSSGVMLVRSGSRTIEAERELTVRGTMPIAIKRILKELGSIYDFLLLDCPPSLSGIVVSALVAADEILIPVTSRGMSLDAVVEVLDLIKEIVDGELRPNMPSIRTLVTEYDGRLNLAQAVRQELVAQASMDGPLNMFQTIIRRNERLAECYGARRSIFDVDARANGADDYTALALEVAG